MIPKPSSAAWFETAFRREYLEVYAHRDQASAAAEVAFLLEQGLDGSVLDLCCGQGRHLIAMRESGLEAFGLDLSHELLACAGSLDGGDGIQGFLTRADQRLLPIQDQTLDGVTLLFSSFGYHDDEGDARVLQELARVLKPNGLLVLDLMNPARIRSSLVPHSVREEQGLRLEETRSLSEDGLRVRKQVRLSRAGNEPLAWREDVRLYDPGNLDSLLEAHKFGGIHRWGGFGGQVFDEKAPRQLVLARRTAQVTSSSLYSDI
jgi:SAM-dependent methyltransferase